MLYQQIDLLNSQPINQLAKKLLKKAGVNPDPDIIYILQLMEWGLTDGGLEVEDVTNKYAHSDTLAIIEKLMFSDNPEKFMDWLTKEGPDEGSPEYTWIDPVYFAKQKEPEDAAAYLIDCLRSAIQYEEPVDRVGDGYD